MVHFVQEIGNLVGRNSIYISTLEMIENICSLVDRWWWFILRAHCLSSECFIARLGDIFSRTWLKHLVSVFHRCHVVMRLVGHMSCDLSYDQLVIVSEGHQVKR